MEECFLSNFQIISDITSCKTKYHFVTERLEYRYINIIHNQY